MLTRIATATSGKMSGKKNSFPLQKKPSPGRSGMDAAAAGRKYIGVDDGFSRGSALREKFRLDFFYLMR